MLGKSAINPEEGLSWVRQDRPLFLERLHNKRKNVIAGLRQEVAQQSDQLANLQHALAERSAQLEHQQLTSLHRGKRLESLRKSAGWRLMWPLRLLQALGRRISGREKLQAVPVRELDVRGDQWVTSGHDPQCLLMGHRAWHAMSGWYWLTFHLETEQPLHAHFFVDIGHGFDPTLVVDRPGLATGFHQIPIYVPRECRMIRFDPAAVPARFRLANLDLRPLKTAPSLMSPFAEQQHVYRKLGGYASSEFPLLVEEGIRLNADSPYRWEVTRPDPKFKLVGAEKRLAAGWYVIALQIETDAKEDCAEFYFDCGDGFNASLCAQLPFTSGETIKRFYRLPRRPRQVRFDPLVGLGLFDVERLSFTRVPTVVALYQVFRHLRERHGLYKGLSAWRISHTLLLEAHAKHETPMALLNTHVGETFRPSHRLHERSYTQWIKKFETPEFTNLAAIKAAQQSFARQPLISVLMPVYDATEYHLRLAIESVIKQSYENWELCIADDASPSPHVKRVLEEYRSKDGRIKVVYRPVNGHISAASNSALELVSGSYVALVDHDDELSPCALHFVAGEINASPQAKVIYSDEDKIDGEGKRFDPHFKPDWNPDLLLSQNYISHLGIYETALLRDVGGFREGFEGSQDYDLLLRCIPRLANGQIKHIPKVLYHWRALEGSTALHHGEKSYTMAAGFQALEDYLKRNNLPARVEYGLAPNTYHVRWEIPHPAPLVSLLIPTRDSLYILEKCVESILDKTTYPNYEIIILDNQSRDAETLEWFDKIQRKANVRVVSYDHPFNYSAINNYGVNQASGEIIGLINNDIEVISPDWLTEMVGHACRPEIGCVGAKLYYDNDTIQHAGVIVGLGGAAGHSHKHFPRDAPGYFFRLKIVQDLSAVTAACMLVRKSIFLNVGALNEKDLAIAFNDVDFCLRVRESGYRNIWTPYAELYHHESVSRGAEDSPEKVARFEKEIAYMKTQWGGQLMKDPAYNPNLTLDFEDFTIRA
jgi:glycosyltransferase involved in cell wall biosynthesis